MAGEDEDFLRRKRQVFARAEGGKRGLEAGGADDGDQNDVGAGQLREFDEAGETTDETSVGGKGRGMGARGREGRVTRRVFSPIEPLAPRRTTRLRDGKAEVATGGGGRA